MSSEPKIEDSSDAIQDDSQFHIQRMSFTREVLMILSVCSAQILVQAILAQGILPVFIIAESFGANDFDATWIPAGYALTSGTFMLPAGRFGDLVGHRICLVVAYVWLALSSLMAGVSMYSGSFVFFALCRGLQGIAGAILVPCALAILGSVYKSGTRKNVVFSLYAAGSPVGYTLGMVFSGMIVQFGWWPWTFFVTTFVCLGLAVLAIITIPKLPFEFLPKEKREVNWKTDFDWWGSITSVSGMILFNFAWNRVPSVGWSSPECIVTLIVGFVIFAVFLFIESRVNNPLVPVDKLQLEAVFVLLVMGLGWSSFGVLVYYLVNFTTQLRGDTLLSTAAQTVPIPLTGLLASLLNSWLLRLGVHSADILAFSTIWFIFGNIILAVMPVRQSYWVETFWIYVLAPFGMDLSFPSATLLMSQLVPVERQGMAASLIATVVYYSQSIGLGIAGTVEAYTSHGDMLKGYRNAVYSGIGLAGVASIVAVWATISLRMKRRSTS